jgi:hypothetical protein
LDRSGAFDSRHLAQDLALGEGEAQEREAVVPGGRTRRVAREGEGDAVGADDIGLVDAPAVVPAHLGHRQGAQERSFRGEERGPP